MSRHIHVHLHDAKDAGTSEGAKKAAQTRKFTAGHGAKPETSGEHQDQAEWHMQQAKSPNATPLAKRQHMQNAQHHMRMHYSLYGK